MAIDLCSESLITLAEAAALAPGRPHLSTVWRWVLHGIRGVHLETVVCGGRRYTSAEAVMRFVAATTAVANGELTPSRTTSQRRKGHEQATAELARDGI